MSYVVESDPDFTSCNCCVVSGWLPHPWKNFWKRNPTAEGQRADLLDRHMTDSLLSLVPYGLEGLQASIRSLCPKYPRSIRSLCPKYQRGNKESVRGRRLPYHLLNQGSAACSLGAFPLKLHPFCAA